MPAIESASGPRARGWEDFEDGEAAEEREKQSLARGKRRRRRRRRGTDVEGSSDLVVGSSSSATDSAVSSLECGDRAILSQPESLAGRELSGGPAPDPGPQPEETAIDIPTSQPHGHPTTTLSRAFEGSSEPEEDPSRNSSSHAFPECQNQQFRSEALPFPCRRFQRQRPASLDLNSQGVDTAVLSPSFFVSEPGVMNKSSGVASRSRLGTFPSPGTPNYHQPGAFAVSYQKGWSSERMRLPSNSNQRLMSSSLVFPFSNGRTLPSKWEDAERWIFGRTPEDEFGRTSVPLTDYSHPKSKSGPIGTPAGIGEPHILALQSAQFFDSGRVGSFPGSKLLLLEARTPEHACLGGGNNGSNGCGVGGGNGGNWEGGKPYSTDRGPHVVPCPGVCEWLDGSEESSSSLPGSQYAIPDAISEENIEVFPAITPVVLRKDVAIQTSPSGSIPCSPKERLFPHSPSALRIQEMESHFSKLEIRDVQVDDQVTLTSWSKKHILRDSNKYSTNIIKWKKKIVEAKASSWEVTEMAKCISRIEREEAKIAAWENQQKAKAEAAMQKLAVKLERKRSSSMDRILNKFKSAQKRAEKMRSESSSNPAHVTRSTKDASHLYRTGQIGSLSGCFTCHAFSSLV